MTESELQRKLKWSWRRRVLEIGFGRSPTVLARAVEDPLSLYLAVDINQHWCRRLESDGKLLRNLAVFQDEAIHFLKEYISSGSLHEIHVYYPTPYPPRFWLMKPVFEMECYRVLHRAGEVVIVTDHPPYFDLIHNVFADDCWMASCWRNMMPSGCQPGVVGTDCEEIFGSGLWIRIVKM